MEKQDSAQRTGTPGLDVFKIAGRSISGFLHSLKTGNLKLGRMPYTSLLELRLALFLEYHPHVQTYQRGDLSKAFVDAYRIFTPLGTPYRINYVFDGKAHEYLPDFVGILCDGGLLVAEAGRESEKRRGQALAKAEAAQRLTQLKGGSYWIGTETNLSERRYHNLLHLHARRQTFSTYDEIAATILNHWPWGDICTVNEFVHLFAARWSEAEVEAAVWKLVGDAAAQGRLLVDLTEVDLSRSTPLALLDPGAPPILPDPLPSSLEEDMVSSGAELETETGNDETVLGTQTGIPGPTFDASVLEKEEERKQFYRNLAAVTAVITGRTQRSVAREYGMPPATLSYLVRRVKALGLWYFPSNLRHPFLKP